MFLCKLKEALIQMGQNDSAYHMLHMIFSHVEYSSYDINFIRYLIHCIKYYFYTILSMISFNSKMVLHFTNYYKKCA